MANTEAKATADSSTKVGTTTAGSGWAARIRPALVLLHLSIDFLRFRLPVLLACVAGIPLTFKVFVSPNEDTTQLAVATLFIVGSLAGLALGYAGALGATETDRDQVLFAGERFCHGTIFLVVAVVLNNSALYIQKQQPLGPYLSGLTGHAYQIIAGSAIMTAYLVSCFGLSQLSQVLARRYSRRPDWNE